MSKVFNRILWIIPWLLVVIPATDAAAGNHQVKVTFRYKDLPAAMKTYLPGKKKFRLWETAVVDNIEALAPGREVKDGVFTMDRGEIQKLILVYENKTAKDLHFFAAPHDMKPAENTLGLRFKCLCVNHVYTVPAGKIWYRMVLLRSRPEASGGAIHINHTLVRATSHQAKSFSRRGFSF